MLFHSQQIATSSHITLLFVSNLCLHISIFITSWSKAKSLCMWKAFSGKHVCGLWKGRVHVLTLYLEKPNDQKKNTADLNTVLFQFYLIPQNRWIDSCWAVNCHFDHLKCRALGLTTLFAFFFLNRRASFLFCSGYEVAMGRISVYFW